MESLESVVNNLRAAGEPTRLRLLAVLSRAELTVTELTQILGQSQPRISRHLKLMCEAGLLERLREGAWVFYRARDVASSAHADEIVPLILKMIPFDDVEICRDLVRLETVRRQRHELASDYFRQNADQWAEIRALHVSEKDVEQAMVDIVGSAPIGAMIDVGTGTGRILELFGPMIGSGIGVDLSHEMLSIARSTVDKPNLSHCQIRQGDLFSLPFENGSEDGSGVDLVTIHQVLHYLTNPSAAIEEAARILAPDGQLLIVDFAPHGFEQLRENHAHRRLGFSDSDISRWCSDVGLKLVDSRHMPPAKNSDDGLTVSLWLAKAKGSRARKPKLEVVS